MSRVVWKGAITFGLVHIPVSLYPGSRPNELDLDLLDKRDFAPVGYQRVNKRTGETVAAKEIVKGYEYEDGQYVVVSDEDFRQANVKATQTVEIQSFVDGAQIPPYYFDTPYYLEPGKRGEKGYALLREALRRSGRVGLATVVIRTRQYLAAVMPVGKVLLLNTLRFASEIRPVSELDLPGENLKKIGVTERELEMAQRLIDDMTEDWKPERYHDTYREELMARIERKVKAGQTRLVTEPETTEAPRAGAQVIDLMAALKRSLDTKRRPPKSAPAERAPRRSSTTRRRARDTGEARRRRA